MRSLSAATLSSATSGTTRPAYDRAELRPGVVHIGMGNFHRAHQAVYLDRLFSAGAGAGEFGVVGVNLLARDEPLARAMAAQDHLYTVLERHPGGGTTARIVGSIIDNLLAPDDPEAVLRLLAAAATRIVTLTITEGGYHQHPVTGEVDLADPALRADLAAPRSPRTAFGYLTEALRRRRAAGVAPFTVLSCDNVVGNGDLTRSVLLAVSGELDPALSGWIAANARFPNAMVDRITLRTTATDIAEAASATGLRDLCPVSCEAFTQWVVEDQFPAGRPAWEQVGVQMVDDVRPYELMKLRLVNAGHQAIAYAGALLGHEFGWQACADPTVRRLLLHYLRHEGAPAVPDVPGIDLPRYCDTVVERFANPQVADTTARLRWQSSTMLSTFVLPVARHLLAQGRDVRAIAAVVACWARVVEGRDDSGKPVELLDVRADELRARAAHPDDPLALVRGNPLFAGLDDHPGFTEPYARTLTGIRRHGTRSTLDGLFPASSDDRRSGPTP